MQTQDVSIHEFKHLANDPSNTASGIFIPSTGRRTGRRRPERWPFASVGLRAFLVSDQSTHSRTIPP